MSGNLNRLSVYTLLSASALVIVVVIVRLWRSLAVPLLKHIREIDRRVTHDDLTGLPNRRHFERMLPRLLDAARRSGMELALLHIDIDHFKVINDIFGTDLADKVLQLTADRIKGTSTPGLIVGRVGDDEFMTLIPGMDQSALLDFAHQIVSRASQPAVFTPLQVPVSVSAGVALCRDEYTDPDNFRRQAMRALRIAKRDGGRTARFYDHSVILDHQHRTLIAEALKRALDSEKNLSLAYQPVFTADRRLYGLEALLRFDSPEQDALPIHEVIAVAEESGLILHLGLWVMKSVCEQLKAWSAEYGRIPPVAVNVSAIEFMQPGFVAQVVDTIRSAGVSSDCLVLELTESTIMSNLVDGRKQLAELHKYGIRIAVDDFGTGYSGLSYLLDLDPDILKIDRSFINRMCNSHKSTLVVRAIIELAQALEVCCIAEGVETEEQFCMLREMRCDFFQGYLFGRPLHPNNIAPLLQGGS